MKTKKLYSLLVLLMVLILPITINAKTFNAKDSITVKDEAKSTRFIAGNNVEAKGRTEGISFVAGNTVEVENEHDYMFVAGNKIDINDVQTKDAFIAGATVDIKNSSFRDLYVAAETIEIEATVDGNLYAGGEKIVINSTINGNVNISSEIIELGENAVINGTLRYPENAKIEKQATSQVAKEKTYKETEIDTKDTARELITSFLTSVLSMILIALVLLALNKKVFEKIEKLPKEAPEIAKTSLLGLGVLTITPILAIILLISTIGIGLSIISLLIYGIMIYVSAIPTSYFVGKWILKDKIKNDYLLISISIFVLYLLRIIPIIGGLITFLSLCFGLGVYIKLLKENTNIK